MTAIALIPGRGGSERIPSKNIKLLNGVPLIAYTVRAALDSGCFDKVLVSSDSTETLEIAARYGADCLRRPDAYATSTSPDIEFVKHALECVEVKGNYDTFSILRPTSPFRLPSTIQRAFTEWNAAHIPESDALDRTVTDKEVELLYAEARTNGFTSLRAVEPVSQHPGKMWHVHQDELVPFTLQPLSQPFHDSQMASLPRVYVQNASLEIAWTKTVEDTGTISGSRVMPFFTEGHEGFDLNQPVDWLIAEQMVLDGVELPEVPIG